MLWRVTFPRKQTQKEFWGPDVYMGVAVVVLEYTPDERGGKLGQQGKVGFSAVTVETSADPQRALELDVLQSCPEWGQWGWILSRIMEQSLDVAWVESNPRGMRRRAWL